MSNPPVTVRFAPSPTGRIHIGNARTAIFNWLFAKKQDGRFVLRFDDTDRARSKEEYARGIEADLNWLGIVPDAIERQSDRFDAYAAAAERLMAAGRLYACYETPDELDRKRKRRRARGLPPIYDRAGLRLTDAERAAFEAEGRKPHWRFLLSNYRTDPETFEPSPIVWDDLVRGHQSIDLGSLSDPVLVREDGTYLYTLPSVVDDIDMAISHVIRGDDHVANTAVQIDLFKALGGTPPAFAHHNLLTSATGEGLSKRIGSLSIKSMREDGFEPMAIVALAARIGTADAVEPVRTMAELVSGFDLARVSMSPARFDPADIGAMNARLLHDTPFTEVEARLAEIGVGGGEAFWLAVRGNVERLRDAAGWWQVVAGPIDPVIDPADRDFLAEALKLLPSEPWDGETWGAWTNALKKATGRKGRALFLPLRLALTGRDDGPELKALLPLIGHRNTTARLS